MLFNKLTCPLVFAVLLVAGLAFVATPATGQLSVVDANTTTPGIQVTGYAGQPVAFEVTITFPEGQVTGFGDADTDIGLIPTRLVNNGDAVVPNGASAGPVATPDNIVYTTTITVTSVVEKVWVSIPAGAARTPGRRVGADIVGATDTAALTK